MSYQVLLFYLYGEIDSPNDFIEAQRGFCLDHGLVGRVLISHEGINGTLCGTKKQCALYEEYMHKQKLFSGINFKKSDSDFICFSKLKVKYKKEIVIINASDKNLSYLESAPKITASLLHKEIEENKDLVLFDMRNQYESAIGRFVNAICPLLQTTRELEQYLENNRFLFDNKDVVMYCTGGVRCEKTSALFKKMTNPKRVRHLENGIHAYVEEFPDGYFRGRNYVFDDRVSLPVNEDVLSHCCICQISCDLYNNCLNAICNKHYICCDHCLKEWQSCCSKDCILLTNNKLVPMRPPLLSRLFYSLPLCVERDVSLKKYNWFETGGSAKYLAQPQTIAAFLEVIRFAQSHALQVKILGKGANSLISDEGFNGVIIIMPKEKPYYEYICQSYGLLTLSAGDSIENAIHFIFEEASLFGLEEFSGIPSSIGGALFINLHYFEFLISQFLEKATVYSIKEQKVEEVSPQWFCFGYDNSKLKEDKNYILLNATFKLFRGTPLQIAYAKGRSKEIIRHRESRYPYQRTCGCFFKNFSAEQVSANHEGKKIIAAGYYLEQVGVKGNLKIGNSYVSSKHANMITHNGKGESQEIITIARIMQEKVFQQFSLVLEPECELIGFTQYPLHTKETLIALCQ